MKRAVALVAVASALVGCATASDGGLRDCPVCAPCTAPTSADAPAKARAPLEAPASSVSDEAPRTLHLRAFSEDSAHVALEVSDDRGGSSLQIMKLKGASVVQTYRFDEASAKSTWSSVRRKHKLLSRSPQTASHPTDGSLSLMGGDDARSALVNVARGERVVPYLRIRRLDDAGIAFKALAFSPDGRWVVVIHTQTLVEGGVEVDYDFFHSVRYKAFRVPF